jgi:hypothetical protein
MSVIFAEANRGASLSESFRSHAGMGRDDVLLGLLMAVTLVAGLWATTRLLGLRRRRRRYHNPGQLFRALAKAHRLTWSDRMLLSRVARQQKIGDPARLFLELQLWDEQALGPAFALEFVRLRTLRKQIFDRETQSQDVETGARRTTTRARNTVLLRNKDLPPSEGETKITGSSARPVGLKRNPEAKPAKGGATSASPLFSSPPAPTLDLPPWTDGQTVDT